MTPILVLFTLHPSSVQKNLTQRRLLRLILGMIITVNDTGSEIINDVAITTKCCQQGHDLLHDRSM
jgi:hypothetical protein